MKIKTSLSLLLALWMVTISSAQELPKSKTPINLKVTYEVMHVLSTIDKDTTRFDTCLDIASDMASYYNYSYNLKDSILVADLEKGLSFNEINTSINKLDLRGYPLSVYSFPQEAKRTISYKPQSENYIYSEPMVRPEWVITDSTSVKHGYNCQLAEADYLGHHWKAWFTDELPTPLGPWKLWGLPGLILEAEEEEGNIRFSLIRIEVPEKQELIDVQKLSPSNIGGIVKSSAKEVNEIFKIAVTDPIGYIMSSMHGVEVKVLDEDGNEISGSSLRKDTKGFVPLEK